MGRIIVQPSFDAWLAYVFDHSVADPAWYWDMDCDQWFPLQEPELAVAYVTRAFEESARVFAPFSNAQLNQGLWFMASNASSDHMLALLDSTIAWPLRQRAIESIAQLYQQLFLVRCGAELLSHLERTIDAARNPLNGICYMLWDLVPIPRLDPGPDRERELTCCLGVLDSILHLESDACREAALHGLGHFHRARPKAVESIIDRFLEAYPPLRHGRAHQPGVIPAAHPLRPELRQYAGNARSGYVQ